MIHMLYFLLILTECFEMAVLVRKVKEKPIYTTGQNFRAPFTAKKLKNTMSFFKVLVFFSFPTRNNILRVGSNVKGIF